MQDYHNFTVKATPKHVREKLGVGDIWINAAKCKKCGDVIRSKNRHDFVSCNCGAVSVDGGSWYAKRVGQLEMCENMIELYDDVRKE